MQTMNVEAYDWIELFGPALEANLKTLLEAKGIAAPEDLHGGAYLDGRWVGVLESKDYRNYWHAYIELWGDGLRNDNYQVAYFPLTDDVEEWQYYKTLAREWANGPYRTYDHTDPNWTDDLVEAVRLTLEQNIEPTDAGGYKLVFWWSW
jgi:hypothetical protein